MITANALSGPSMPLLRYFSLHEVMPAKPLLLLLGALVVAMHLALLLAPKPSLQVLDRFPRHWLAGIILTAVCVPWFALLLNYNMPFLWMQGNKSLIVMACLALFFPIVWFMKDLLSVRALGCFLLLLAAPVIRAVLWDSVDWARWLVTSWCYLIAVVGMIFVLYPFRFRRWVQRFLHPDPSRKIYALAGVVTGLLLVAAGLSLGGPL